MRVNRYIVPNREITTVAIDINGKKYNIRIKISKLGNGEVVSIKPEFEDLRNISIETGIPLRDLLKIVMKIINSR
jgi:uncharacterized protein (DUF111 family)